MAQLAASKWRVRANQAAPAGGAWGGAGWLCWQRLWALRACRQAAAASGKLAQSFYLSNKHPGDKMNSPQRLHKFGQPVWFDYIWRNMYLSRPSTNSLARSKSL